MGVGQLDGFETATRIRTIESKLKNEITSYEPITIIAHSGDDSKTIRQSPKFKASIDSFATKPIKAELMQKVLQTLISRLNQAQMRENLLKIFSPETSTNKTRSRTRVYSMQH